MSIDLERDGAIAIVTVNRPDRLNALSSADLKELQETLRTIGGDRAIRAVILTGAGDRAFIAGADIREMSAFTEDEAMAFGRLGHDVASAIEHLPQPVIAAVNGYAFGGGCELALAADIRIASTNAEFSQPEVKLGIPPGWGGTQRLPRVVGPGHAAELILTGRRVNAEEALRIGLVNAIHEPEALLDAARSIAEQIAANSPNAVRLAKSLMSAEQRQDPVVGLDAEAHAFASAFDHPDQKAGMTAFLEKRAATFVDQAT
jgi:enoyl-CoA hydratase